MEARVFEHFRQNEGRHWWHTGKYACAMQLLRDLRVDTPRVLEIGASFGSLSRKIKDLGECIALDRSIWALNEGGYSPCVCGDGEELPFKNGSFDIIVALDVLEHLKNDNRCIAEVVRVLRPNGYIIVFVPACPILWSDLDEINRHYRRYTSGSLLKLFSPFKNLTVCRLSHFNFLLFGPIFIIRLFQKIFMTKTSSGSPLNLGMPPLLINEILKKIFSLEVAWLAHADFPIGVSLIAILKIMDLE